jgi:protein-disulfide isomerase
VSVGSERSASAAPITIVEFSDFQCPYCVRAEKTVKALMESEEYRGKIRLVYRDLPLQGHTLAAKAAEATHCAADQGKYWQMHDKLFEASPKLEVSDLKGYARGIGLDATQFDACLDSGSKAGLVLDQALAAERMGVDATPAFFINGQLLTGAQPLEAFKFLIDGELAAREAKVTAGVQTTPAGSGLNALGTR